MPCMFRYFTGSFKGSLAQGVPEDTMPTAGPIKQEHEKPDSDKMTKNHMDATGDASSKPPLKRTDSKQSQVSSVSSNTSVVANTTSSSRTVKQESSKNNTEASKTKNEEQQSNNKSKNEQVKSKGVKNDHQPTVKTSKPSSSGDATSNKQISGGSKAKDDKPTRNDISQNKQDILKLNYNVVDLLQKGKTMT